MILDHFTDLKTNTATIYRNIGTFNPSTGKVENTETSQGTATCIHYIDTAAQSVIADKIDETVDATAIFEASVDILPRDVIEVQGKKYTAVYADNVGFQGEAVVVSLKDIT